MTLDQIKNLLYATPGNRACLDLLAPQEAERLVFLVQEALSKAGSPDQNAQAVGYNLWAEKFGQEITKELKELEDVFGLKNLGGLLNWQEFLKQAYALSKTVREV